MKPFAIEPLERAKVSDLGSLRSRIDLHPSYQRRSDIWPTAKRQLFIDSLLNGFDVPKLYFHSIDKKKGIQFAVVDGKQRLEAIWAFLDNELPLSDECEWLENDELSIAGRKYSELPPKVQEAIDSYDLPIQVIFTENPSWVEDLFLRLNEAVALNAPEKRNAMGGPLTQIIRELPDRKFFTNRLPFANGRYRHFDLVTKFLYLEHVGGPSETKRRTLDAFVKDFRDRDDTAGAKKLKAKTEAVLARLEGVFGKSDSLLSSLGLVVIYYLLERDKGLSSIPDCRESLAHFDELRRQVRTLMRTQENDDVSELDGDLVEFERVSQSPNDVAAMKQRMNLLLRYLKDPNLITKKLRDLR